MVLDTKGTTARFIYYKNITICKIKYIKLVLNLYSEDRGMTISKTSKLVSSPGQVIMQYIIKITYLKGAVIFL